MGSQPTQLNLKGLSVLVIDDQFTMRKAIYRILVARGFKTILEAKDGSAALKLLDKNPVDLVILDIFMPGLDGFQTLKSIRDQNFGADTPVIMVTGEGNKDDIVKAVDMGANDYLVKPFQIDDLEKKVTAVLRDHLTPTPLLRLLRGGDKLSLEGRHSDALKLYEAAERLSPENARATLGKSLALHHLGMVDEALSILNSSAEKSPHHFKTFKVIADILLQKNDIAGAITAMRHEIDLNPKQPDRQILLGKLLKSAGDLLGALDHFRSALLEQPKNKDALILAGITHGEMAEVQPALNYFRRARRHHPTWLKPLELAAQLLANHVDMKSALVFLVDELKLHPSRSDLRILIAKIHAKENNLNDALKVLDEGLARPDKTIGLLKAKANLLKQYHQTALACELYRQVLQAEPTKANELLLANALIHDKQFQAVCDLLTSNADSDGDRSGSLHILAEALLGLARPRQALHVLQLAEAIRASAPSSPANLKLKSLKSELKADRNRQFKLSRLSKTG